MTFNYIRDIPLATNNPSTDQPNMKQDTNAIDNWSQVNHVGFNVGTAGQHTRIDFNANITSPSIASGAVAVETVNAGVASSASQLFFTNANATFHLSPIRAWGIITAAGAIDNSQSYNVASASRFGAGAYVINLTAGATSSVNYGVHVSTQRTSGFINAVNYSIVSTTQFNVLIVRSDNTAIGEDAKFTFMILQI